MNQNLIHQAQELQKKGYSIRQIASELNVSKSQVFRWLNGQSGNGGNSLPIDLIAKANMPNHQTKNYNKMENHNDLNRLEREIALKKLQLEHELELRKLAQQDKELELRKRELELKHLEKDAIARQQQIEERKINHGLKVWIEKERALLSEFDYEEIEMDLAAFKRSYKTLSKLWEQVQEHMAVYGIDTDSHLGHYYFKSLMDMFNKALDTANDNVDDDEDEDEFMVSYAYDDDSIEFLDNLGDSDFFS
ncbi:MAG: helix-turn-helix domain-containing protein [Bacteroidia bacterium]|nr:helix-turn-helix domain-containing protein [Bacteroidia bacterium]